MNTIVLVVVLSRWVCFMFSSGVKCAACAVLHWATVHLLFVAVEMRACEYTGVVRARSYSALWYQLLSLITR